MATYEPIGDLKYHRISHNMFIIKRNVDVDRQTGASVDGQIDQNDVLTALPVRAGDIVLSAWANIITACTGAASFDIGVGENVDYWVDGAPLDGLLIDTNTTAAQGSPHQFSVADTIDLKVLEAGVTAGRFEVCALVVRI
jgi:hypothetical protein